MICVNSVSVSPGSISIQKGTGHYLGVAVSPSNATCNEIYWYSSNSGVVSVDSSTGYVYGVKAGTARIYAMATDGSGASDYCTVTVTDYVPVTSIVINTSQLTMDVGDEDYLHAVVCPENASNDGVVWDSSNLSVVSVDSETGKVTAIGPGNAVIYAIAKNESNVFNVCYVTVNQCIYVNIVELTPPNLKVKVGDTGHIVATVCPENATNTSLIWHSTNPEVLEVGVYTGNYKAKKVGTAIVSATATDGSDKSACCIVTVEAADECVSVSPKKVIVDVGNFVQLIVDYCPESSVNRGVYWYSENSNIVEVDSNMGLIEAKSLGTTKVWAVSLDDNSNSDFCTVTVVGDDLPEENRKRNWQKYLSN